MNDFIKCYGIFRKKLWHMSYSIYPLHDMKYYIYSPYLNILYMMQYCIC